MARKVGRVEAATATALRTAKVGGAPAALARALAHAVDIGEASGDARSIAAAGAQLRLMLERVLPFAREKPPDEGAELIRGLLAADTDTP
jgi:hypothetical protein